MADRLGQTASVAAMAALLLALPARAAEGGLELVPDPAVLVVLLVVFAALAYPVNNLVFRPIFRVLEERDQRIAGTRSRAQDIGAEAEELLRRYESAIAETRESAESDRRARLDDARSAHASRTSEARSAAEQEVTRARAEIASELESGRGALRAQAEELANGIAARVLGRAGS